MKVVGLIVEYNPLHNGHYYHFEQAKKSINADAVVLVMSGNFLQRGEPALVDKWARTEMALQMGVDLVFELPYVYATQHAQYFAYGAVSVLHQLPFVTHLCFGSEKGEIEPFLHYAGQLTNEPELLKQKLKAEIKKGYSYPRAYMNALQSTTTESIEDPDFFKQPNNILGLQYVLALKKLQSEILPTTIKREKAGYHEIEFTDKQIASATSIRHALFSTEQPSWEKIKTFVPSFTFNILQREVIQGKGLISWENFYSYVTHSLLSQSGEHLKSLYEIEEGIEFRLKDKALLAQSVNHLVELVKTKRYTWNRIQRMLVHILHQFSKQEARTLSLAQGVAYLRLLGYSKLGKILLNQSKKSLQLPLISSIRKEHPPMLDWDIKSSLIYSLGFPIQRNEDKKRELRQPPLFLE